jgi:DNA/RNA endonuclease YhcR with UshA esterase domain
MHRVIHPLIALLVLFAAACTLGEPATTAPATSNATVVKPDDKEAIAANMDKDVVIEGTIESAAWSGTGKVMAAHFKDGAETKLQAVIFVKNRDKFDKEFSGDVAKALTGAKVRVKGKLKEFKGSPEVVMDTADQVTIVEAAPAAPAEPAAPADKTEERR